MDNKEFQNLILKEIDKINRRLDALSSSNSIPFNVEQALRDRLGLASVDTIDLSNKSASSENQAVNEGGIATYFVMKPPDGFVQLTKNGVVIYIPYFN